MDIAQATFVLNNVKDRILDLYSADNILPGARVTILNLLFPLKSGGQLLAFYPDVGRDATTQTAEIKLCRFSALGRQNLRRVQLLCECAGHQDARGYSLCR